MVNIGPVLAALGIDPEPVFKSCGLDAKDFKDPDHRVGYLDAGDLLSECVRLTGCEHFGLLVGEKGTPFHLGIPGFLAHAANSTGQALAVLVEYLDLHDQGSTLALETGDKYSQLSFHIHERNMRAVAQVCDLAAAMMVITMRDLCGNDWSAAAVHLPHSKSVNQKPYEQFFRCTVYFDSDFCGIVFPSHWLQTNPPSADSPLFLHLEREARLMHGHSSLEFLDVLRSTIQRGLLQQRSAAPEVAAAIGLNERTLNRRLHAIGSCYRQELDAVRKHLSQQLLRSTRLPVCDIAQSMGYSDSSTFIRAFKRWAQSSPAAWRKQNAYVANTIPKK